MITKNLIKFKHRAKGRNNQGKITVFHRGGGHKRLYRRIDFKRNKYNIIGKISSIEYDPNRTARISLVKYTDGEQRYILAYQGIKIGNIIKSEDKKTVKNGNATYIKNIPIGTDIHNIEFKPNYGGQIARSSGTFAKILTKHKNYVVIKLPSKNIYYLHNKCYATIGKVYEKIKPKLTKAGQNRWRGIRPTVRGSAMNACDHPHGGGEGKSPIGRKRPLTPWGKIALGKKTRKKKK